MFCFVSETLSVVGTFQVGDYVQLTKNRKGKIKFLGYTEFSKNEEVAGVELDEANENGHDGGNSSFFFFTFFSTSSKKSFVFFGLRKGWKSIFYSEA